MLFKRLLFIGLLFVTTGADEVKRNEKNLSFNVENVIQSYKIKDECNCDDDDNDDAVWQQGVQQFYDGVRKASWNFQGPSKKLADSTVNQLEVFLSKLIFFSKSNTTVLAPSSTAILEAVSKNSKLKSSGFVIIHEYDKIGPVIMTDFAVIVSKLWNVIGDPVTHPVSKAIIDYGNAMKRFTKEIVSSKKTGVVKVVDYETVIKKGHVVLNAVAVIAQTLINEKKSATPEMYEAVTVLSLMLNYVIIATQGINTCAQTVWYEQKSVIPKNVEKYSTSMDYLIVEFTQSVNAVTLNPFIDSITTLLTQLINLANLRNSNNAEWQRGIQQFYNGVRKASRSFQGPSNKLADTTVNQLEVFLSKLIFFSESNTTVLAPSSTAILEAVSKNSKLRSSGFVIIQEYDKIGPVIMKDFAVIVSKFWNIIGDPVTHPVSKAIIDYGYAMKRFTKEIVSSKETGVVKVVDYEPVIKKGHAVLNAVAVIAQTLINEKKSATPEMYEVVTVLSLMLNYVIIATQGINTCAQTVWYEQKSVIPKNVEKYSTSMDYLIVEFTQSVNAVTLNPFVDSITTLLTEVIDLANLQNSPHADWQQGVQQFAEGVRNASRSFQGPSNKLAEIVVNKNDVYISKLIYFTKSNTTVLAPSSTAILEAMSKGNKLQTSGVVIIEEYDKIVSVIITDCTVIVSKLWNVIGDPVTHPVSKALNDYANIMKRFLNEFVLSKKTGVAKVIDYEPVIKQGHVLLNAVAVIAQTLINEKKSATPEMYEAVTVLSLILTYVIIAIQGINSCAQTVWYEQKSVIPKNVEKYSATLEHLVVELTQSVDAVTLNPFIDSITTLLTELINLANLQNSPHADWQQGVQQFAEGVRNASRSFQGPSNKLAEIVVNKNDVYISKLIYFTKSNTTVLAPSSTAILEAMSKGNKLQTSGVVIIEEYDKIVSVIITDCTVIVSKLWNVIGDPVTHPVSKALNDYANIMKRFLNEFVLSKKTGVAKVIDYEPVIKQGHVLLNAVAVIAQTLINEKKSATPEMYEAVTVLSLILTYVIIAIQGINSCAQTVWYEQKSVIPKNVEKYSATLEHLVVELTQSVDAVTLNPFIDSITTLLTELINLANLQNSPHADWQQGVQQFAEGVRNASRSFQGPSNKLAEIVVNKNDVYISKLIYFTKSNTTVLAPSSTAILEAMSKGNKLQTSGVVIIEEYDKIVSVIITDCTVIVSKLWNVIGDPVTHPVSKALNDYANIMKRFLNEFVLSKKTGVAKVIDYEPVIKQGHVLLNAVAVIAQTLINEKKSATPEMYEAVTVLSLILTYVIIAIQGINSCAQTVWYEQKSVIPKNVEKYSATLEHLVVELTQSVDAVTLNPFIDSITTLLTELINLANLQNSPHADWQQGVQQFADGVRNASQSFQGPSNKLVHTLVNQNDVYIPKLIFFSKSNTTVLAPSSTAILRAVSKGSKLQTSALVIIEEYNKIGPVIMNDFTVIISKLSDMIGELTYPVNKALNSFSNVMKTFTNEFVLSKETGVVKVIDYEPVIKEGLIFLNIVGLIAETLVKECKSTAQNVYEAVTVLCLILNYVIFAIQGINTCTQTVWYEQKSVIPENVEKYSATLEYLAIEFTQSVDAVTLNPFVDSITTFLTKVVNLAISINSKLKDDLTPYKGRTYDITYDNTYKKIMKNLIKT